MECPITSDLENCGTEENKEGGEKIAKGFKVGSAPRKRLADISNVQQQYKQMNLKQHPALLSSNDNVDKLYKENVTLMKLVADRKLIELSGKELEKLRVNFQKAQQQNVQLAQTNSQMLAELNSGKDKLRLLQHELGCKNGLLHAKKLQKERRKTAATDGRIELLNADPAQNAQAVESSSIENTKIQSYDVSEKGQSRRSSLDLSARNIGTDDDKRPARRQSMRFKAGESRPTQDLFEIDEAKVPVSSLCDDLTEVNCAISEGSALGKEDKGDNGTTFETQENRRSSIGRPMRRAVEKVRSYKETPLNVKMRRENDFLPHQSPIKAKPDGSAGESLKMPTKQQ